MKNEDMIVTSYMRKWQKAEKQDSKLFNARRQKGSGNQDHYPMDIVSDTYAIETKQTDKKSYSITQKTWNKICEETAVLDQKDNKNRIPVLSLHLQNTNLIILSVVDFEKLKEKAWMYDDLFD